MTGGSGRGHALGGANEGIGGVEVEEIEGFDVEVFWRAEDVQRDAICFTGFVVNSVEEIEQELEPFEDDVEFLLVERTLLRRFIREWWNDKGFDG